MKNEKTILVGVDPSFTNLGMAIYNPETKKICDMKKGEFQPMIEWLGQNVDLTKIIAIVENPALDKTVFNIWYMVKAEFEDVIHNMFWKCLKFGLPKKWINSILSFLGQTKR